MRRFLPLAALTAFMGAPFAAADNSGPERSALESHSLTHTDKERIQGTWIIIGVEADGKEIHSIYLKSYFTFTGSTLQWPWRRDSGVFSLCPELNPATLDYAIEFENGHVIVQTLLLYELEGDTLRLCYDQGNREERPKTFNSKGRQMIFTLQRENQLEK